MRRVLLSVALLAVAPSSAIAGHAVVEGSSTVYVYGCRMEAPFEFVATSGDTLLLNGVQVWPPLRDPQAYGSALDTSLLSNWETRVYGTGNPGEDWWPAEKLRTYRWLQKAVDIGWLVLFGAEYRVARTLESSRDMLVEAEQGGEMPALLRVCPLFVADRQRCLGQLGDRER